MWSHLFFGVRLGIWITAALALAKTFFILVPKVAGSPVLPLDDAYIYLRYAEHMFDLGPYRLELAQPFSSGATSLAYPWIVAVAHVLGVTWQQLPAFVFWSAAVFLGVLAHLAYELTGELVDLTHIRDRASPSTPKRRSPLAEGISLVSGKSPAGGLAGLLAGCVILSSADLVWGVLIGMEGGLYVCVLVAALLVWSRAMSGGWHAPTARWIHTLHLDAVCGRTPLQKLSLLALIGALPLCRPEGAPVALVLTLAAVLAAPPKKRLRAALPWALALAPWALAVGIHALWLGQLAPNTAIAKSVAHEPYTDSARHWQMTKEILTSLLKRLRGDVRFGAPALLWPAMSLGLALVGCAVGLKNLCTPLVRSTWAKIKRQIPPGWRRRLFLGPRFGPPGSTSLREQSGSAPWHHGLRSPWAALAAAALLITLGLSQNRVFYFDHNRYLLGLLVLIVILASATLGVLSAKLKVVWLLPFAAYFALDAGEKPLEEVKKKYRKHCLDLKAFQISIGDFARGRLDRNAVIGINDAGAIPFYARRRAFDLVGLTTNGMAEAFRHGNGSLFEKLERLPASRRPTHFAVFPRYLRSTGLLGKRLFRPPARRKAGSRANINVLYEARWATAKSGHPLPYAVARQAATDGRAVTVDRVDVADLENERAHRYHNPRPDLKWHAWRIHYSLVRWERRSNTGPTKTAGQISDGGRAVAGRERMQVKLCPQSRPCFWAARLAAYRSVTLNVSVCGHSAGRVTLKRSRRFRLVTLALPSTGKKSCTLEISVHPAPAKRDRKRKADYVAYQHWIVAGAPSTANPRLGAHTGL
jgi:hypothetical protein